MTSTSLRCQGPRVSYPFQPSDRKFAVHAVTGGYLDVEYPRGNSSLQISLFCLLSYYIQSNLHIYHIPAHCLHAMLYQTSLFALFFLVLNATASSYLELDLHHEFGHVLVPRQSSNLQVGSTAISRGKNYG